MADLTWIQILWFSLLAVLWIGYLTLDGFDLGVAMILRIATRNGKERRAALNAIGPHWDGNEVWVLTAGGATFAAFPEWYATMFSGMYLALIVVLLCLILRVAAIEWRKTINSEKWVNTWDSFHIGAAWVLSLLWGVAFANLVQGTAIKVGKFVDGEFQAVDPSQLEVSANYADHASATASALVDNYHYIAPEENFLMQFLGLLSPFTVLGGLVTLSLFLAHGALFLSLKTVGDLRTRALGLAKKFVLADTVITAVWAIWATFGKNDSGVVYNNSGMLTLIPLAIAAVLLIVTVAFTYKESEKAAFFSHFGAIAFAVVFIWFCIAGDAMKSSVDTMYSLTLAQASATSQTHTVMLIATVIFVPLILGYTIWAYWRFAKRLNAEEVPDELAGIDYKKIRQFEVAA
ncbi:MAG: cytochrome d ubiquinol oxidase subunit II [Actinomycetaceae bacterium]|nr:cytochrome d ubiquinol oxidase subunit II [Actinomycetaceae bacterium]